MLFYYTAAGGKFVMGGLPAPGVQYAAGEDSDDPDAAEDEGAAVQAPDMGQVRPASTVALHMQIHVRQHSDTDTSRE